MSAPERIYADRGPKGGWMFREERMPDTMAEYVRADLLATSQRELAEARAARDDILADHRLFAHHRKKQADHDTELLEAFKSRAEAAEALRAELEAMKAIAEKTKLHLSAWEDSARINKYRAEAAEARATASERQVEAMQEALKPFATYLDLAAFDLDNNGQPLPDSEGMGWVYLTIGDFRRARTILNPSEKNNG